MMSYKSDIEFSLLDVLNEDKMMVTYDKRKHKFSFYDSKQLMLGSFTTNQLIKYIGKSVDSKFMEAENSGLSEEIIESFVVKINKYDNSISLISQHISPFMGNIEMLLKMYTQISKFDTQNDRVNKIILEFNYYLAKHILSIIGTIIPRIINDDTRKTIKESLMYYSSILIKDINTYVMTQIEQQKSKLDSFEENLYKLTVIKTALNSKIDSLAERCTNNIKIQSAVQQAVQQAVSSSKLVFNEFDEASRRIQQEVQQAVQSANGQIGGTIDEDMDDITPTSNIVEEIFNVEMEPPVFDSENIFDTDYTQVGGKYSYISDSDEDETDFETGGIFNVV